VRRIGNIVYALYTHSTQEINTGCTMHICRVLLVSLVVLSGCQASPQGFFGGLRNLFGRFMPRVRPAASSSSGAARPSGPSGPCRSSGPNHNIGNQQFLVSWRLGCTSFTASEGAAYCSSNGMRAVSLDTPQKESDLMNLLTREGQPYFWTGGRVNHAARSVTWPSGATTSRHRWSSGQPNNAEGREDCLAIIVKGTPGFNDVACHHRKPVICQQ